MAGSTQFEALERLKNYLIGIRRNHVATMNHYASGDGKGFWHQPSRRDHASLSSTATCVSSLVRANLWKATNKTWGTTPDVAARLLRKPWESAGLKKNNPFGLSFIAEGVLDLVEADRYERCERDLKVVQNQIVKLLKAEIRDTNKPLAAVGSVQIDPYPPSAYLTQLAFRVLKRCGALEEDIVKGVRQWALAEIHRQIALLATGSRTADPFQLAYAIILYTSAATDEQNSPEEKALINAALRKFFEVQQEDGLWPPSQPIFHYPDVGNAQCFEYELLTQLLICEPLQEELLQYLPNLEKIATKLQHTAFDLGVSKTGTAVGWASGHHPQIAGPESWSTASVYDFVHSLDRLVAEAIRQELFRELKAVYTPPERISRPPRRPEEFALGFLDAKLSYNDGVLSLRDTLRDRFVVPIEGDRASVANGGSLKDETPMSAIFFGPPGTSKTELAKIIGAYIGWPLLPVDPSYIVQDGLGDLHARANKLFSILTMTEQVVVLLDEFDEMGRDREHETELLSRFITTSMLPKLAAINKERKIVFLLATNYLSKFDAAFSRGGRFDMLLQIMQPTLAAKLANPKWKDVLTDALNGLGDRRGRAEEALADLTFIETKLAAAGIRDGEEPYETLLNAQKNGTLSLKSTETETWKQVSEHQAKRIRLPVVPSLKPVPAKKAVANKKGATTKKSTR